MCSLFLLHSTWILFFLRERGRHSVFDPSIEYTHIDLCSFSLPLQTGIQTIITERDHTKVEEREKERTRQIGLDRSERLWKSRQDQQILWGKCDPWVLPRTHAPCDAIDDSPCPQPRRRAETRSFTSSACKNESNNEKTKHSAQSAVPADKVDVSDRGIKLAFSLALSSNSHRTSTAGVSLIHTHQVDSWRKKFL